MKPDRATQYRGPKGSSAAAESASGSPTTLASATLAPTDLSAAELGAAAERGAAALLRMFVSKRFLQFAAVGASGVVVNLLTLRLLLALGLQVNLASAAAIELSLLSNFVLNSRWTFADKASDLTSWQRLMRFHLVCLAGALIQFMVFVVLNVLWLRWLHGSAEFDAYMAHEHGWFNRWVILPVVTPPRVGAWVYLSQTIGIGLALFWNFLLNLTWTWGPKGGQ